jgi:hypothetical protein
MSEAAFWTTLVLIGVLAVGLLYAALRGFEGADHEPIEHEVDEP